MFYMGNDVSCFFKRRIDFLLVSDKAKHKACVIYDRELVVLDMFIIFYSKVVFPNLVPSGKIVISSPSHNQKCEANRFF